jgi:hypothetical protein
MAPETWTIILQQDMGGGGSGEAAGGGGAGGAGSNPQGETPTQRKSLFEDAGKVFGAIAGSAGILAILIRSIGESTVFSTFMNVILKVLGAVLDMLLIATLPLFMVVLNFLLKLIPLAQELGQIAAPLIKLMADKLEKILDLFMDWLKPTLTTLVQALVKFGTTGDVADLLKWGEKFFKDLFDLASKLFMDMINWIKEKGPAIVESIGKSVTLFADWLSTNGPTIINTIVSGIKIMQETLDPLFKQLVAVLGPIFEQLFKPLIDKAKEYWEWLKNTAKIVWDGILEYFRAVWSVLSVYIQKEIGWLVATMASLFGTALWHWWDFMTGDTNKTGANAIAASLSAALASQPSLGALPDINQAIQEIKDKIPKMPDLLSANNPVVDAINKQTGVIKEGDDKVAAAASSGSYSSTGGQRISRYSWEGIGESNTGAGCSVSKSSNASQTGGVELAQWAKTIYENMTGKKYI